MPSSTKIARTASATMIFLAAIAQRSSTNSEIEVFDKRSARLSSAQSDVPCAYFSDFAFETQLSVMIGRRGVRWQENFP